MLVGGNSKPDGEIRGEGEREIEIYRKTDGEKLRTVTQKYRELEIGTHGKKKGERQNSRFPFFSR